MILGVKGWAASEYMYSWSLHSDGLSYTQFCNFMNVLLWRGFSKSPGSGLGVKINSWSDTRQLHPSVFSTCIKSREVSFSKKKWMWLRCGWNVRYDSERCTCIRSFGIVSDQRPLQCLHQGDLIQLTFVENWQFDDAHYAVLWIGDWRSFCKVYEAWQVWQDDKYRSVNNHCIPFGCSPLFFQPEPFYDLERSTQLHKSYQRLKWFLSRASPGYNMNHWGRKLPLKGSSMLQRLQLTNFISFQLYLVYICCSGRTASSYQNRWNALIQHSVQVNSASILYTPSDSAPHANIFPAVKPCYLFPSTAFSHFQTFYLLQNSSISLISYYTKRWWTNICCSFFLLISSTLYTNSKTKLWNALVLTASNPTSHDLMALGI